MSPHPCFVLLFGAFISDCLLRWSRSINGSRYRIATFSGLLKRIRLGEMSSTFLIVAPPGSMYWRTVLGALLFVTSQVGAYDVFHSYAGSNFFDGWNFYGSWDNLTLGASSTLRECLVPMLIAEGNVTWVTQEVASSQNLAYVTSDNHVIIKVDNVTNVQPGQLRNSVWNNIFLVSERRMLIWLYQVRITTQDAYDLGSLWMIDLNHIPYGCSVRGRCCDSFPKNNHVFR